MILIPLVWPKNMNKLFPIVKNRLVITVKYLEKKDACRERIEYFKEHFGDKVDHRTLVKHLISKGLYEWANWLISKALSSDNRVRYGIYAAKLVLPIYKKYRRNDDRPRNAIKAAKNWMKTAKNWLNDKVAYYEAAKAVSAAVDAAREADIDDDIAAAKAADAASNAAELVAYSHSDIPARVAANDAAEAAAYSVAGVEDFDTTYNDTLLQIISYGLELLNNQETLNYDSR